MSKTSDAVRAQFGAGDTKRDEGLTTPKTIVRYDDLCYGDDPLWQVLDVYRPKNQEGRLPVIVSFHGGGWVYGDKERYQYYTMSLAERGFAVVNFTYRLAPEFKFPAALADMNAVMTWVIAHADTYGFDLDYVFATGDSAGGMYLGLYTCMMTNEAYAASYDFKVPSGITFKAISLNSGAYQIDQADSLTQALMADLLADGGTPEEMAQINVLAHMTSRFPPCFVTTEERDFLKDQAKPFVECLMALDIPCVYRYYTNQDQSLGHVFMLNIKRDEATICNDEQCAFFKTFIKYDQLGGKKYNEYER